MAAKLSPLLGLTLVRDGDYRRHFWVCRRFEIGVVIRKKCRNCGVRFSLLPNDVIPMHSYGLSLIQSRLQASLEGVADRSRAFYKDHQLLPDDLLAEEAQPPTLSWSDQLNDEPLRPSHQLFASWRRKWPRRAQVWLHLLLLACIHIGADLSSAFAQKLQNLAECPLPMRSFAHAVGLISLLRDESAKSAFAPTIVLLACRPAHKNFRAVGRPPPYLWGALEFNPPGPF